MGIWKSEVGTGKSMEKANVIQFHQWTEVIYINNYSLYFHMSHVKI